MNPGFKNVFHPDAIGHFFRYRLLKQIKNIPLLLDRALVKNSTASRQSQRFPKIMRDHQKRGVRILVKQAEHLLNIGPEIRIQGGQRFIQKQYLRLNDQRPCQGNPLFFTHRLSTSETDRAGEKSRAARPADASAGLGPLRQVHGTSVRTVYSAGHSGEETGHDPDRPVSTPRFSGVNPGDVPAVEYNFPAGYGNQAGNRFQKNGFPGSGWPHEHEKIMFP